MSRMNGFYLCMLVVIAQATAAGPNSESERPNLLLLFPDQWRSDWDSFHESVGPISMPTLEAFALNGTRFENAYVAAPVCAPSRSCLAAGREYDFAGVPNNMDNDYNINIPTFYAALQAAGYHTMTTGKDDLTKQSKLGTTIDATLWNGTYHQAELGFSDGMRCEGKLDLVIDRKPHDLYGHWLAQQTVTNFKTGETMTGWEGHYACMTAGKQVMREMCTRGIFPDKLYQDNWVGDSALELLRRKPAGKPWFMQVNFPGPHSPFLVTPNMTFRVKNKVFVHQNTIEHCKKVGRPTRKKRGVCSYAAELENMDRLFAMILDEVDSQGELANTVVCISSDHGDMLGDHGLFGKEKPWRGSVAVPLICSGPGIAQGRVVSRPVTTLDLAGTFMDYGQATPAQGMTTKSLRPLLQSSVNEGLLTHTQEMQDTWEQYRPFILSGLQSYAFDSELGNEEGEFAWRMVVEASTGLKLVCCKGACPGAPYNIPAVDKTTGYTQVLYNTTNDKLEMFPLNDAEWAPEAMNSLRKLLPSTFRCGQEGGLTAKELAAVLGR